jgi:iron complex outermembrane receptor protein
MEISKDQSTGFGGGVDAFEDEDDVAGDPWTASDEAVGGSDKTSKKIFANVSWDTPAGAVSFIPSYAVGDGTSESTMMNTVSYITTDSEETSLELRMTSSPDLFFSWIVGVTYYDYEDASYSVEEGYLADGVNGGFTDRTMMNENKAYYINVTYPVLENTRLTVGVRQSWDEMISDNRERRQSMDGDGSWQETPEYLVQKNEGEPDWKLGVEYDLGENAMVYADYSTSYRVQGMSGIQDTDKTEPTRFKVYTVGSKNRFFDNRLQLNGSAYYYDYRNYQADNMQMYWLNDDGPTPLVIDPGEATSEALPALGDGKVYGFDVQATAVLTSQDRLDLSLSYLKSEWKDLFFDYSYPGTLVLTPDGNGTEWLVIEDEDYSGKPMMNTPEWTVNLSYNHTFDLPNGGALKAAFNSKFQSGYRLSWRTSDYPLNYQEDFHIEDATLTYNHPDGKWSLSAYAKNIFDYAEKRMYMSMGGSGTLTLGEPRTYGATLSVRY